MGWNSTHVISSRILIFIKLQIESGFSFGTVNLEYSSQITDHD